MSSVILVLRYLTNVGINNELCAKFMSVTRSGKSGKSHGKNYMVRKASEKFKKSQKQFWKVLKSRVKLKCCGTKIRHKFKKFYHSVGKKGREERDVGQGTSGKSQGTSKS